MMSLRRLRVRDAATHVAVTLTCVLLASCAMGGVSSRRPRACSHAPAAPVLRSRSRAARLPAGHPDAEVPAG